MKPNLSSLGLLLICHFTFWLITSLPIFGQYRFDAWTTDNGLPQNGLRGITQTPDGYLWFTTFDGLVRFDGVRFMTFNKGNTKGILNNRFTGLFQDKQGNLWANTLENGVLTVYRNGIFSTFTEDEIPGQNVREIQYDATGELRFKMEDEDRNGRSWFRLRNNKFVFLEKSQENAKTFVYQSPSGTSWIITPTETKAVRDGVETIYPLKIRHKDFIVSAYEDKQGNLWIGENVIHHLHHGVSETFSEKEGVPLSNFHSFWEEADGSLWIASGGLLGSGVGLLQYKNGRFLQWSTNAGLSNPDIYNFFKDREGTIWLATNKGLNRLRREVMKGYSTKDGLIHSEVYPLYRDSKENIWIGTAFGLSVYRNGKFESLALPQPAGGEAHEIDSAMSHQSLWEDPHGAMWIGVTGGLFLYQDGKLQTLYKQGGTAATAIQPDRHGNVWVATNKGLLQYKDYKQVATYTVKDGLPNDIVTTIHEDATGKLWFGSFGGLIEFKDGKFITYSKKHGLAGNYVRTIYEDKEGTFWIGTYDAGLSRFKNGQFVSYTVDHGLYNNGVFAIQEDPHGNFWISSNRGIYRVQVKDLNDFAEGKITKLNSIGYGKADGMLNTECNGGRQPSSLKDKDGKFWFPTQDGVVVVDPDAETYSPLPPSVVIETATVEREPVDFYQGIRIEPGQRNIEIQYTGLSLIKSEQIKFKYKLEGFDPDWIDAGTRRTAYYSYLPPGVYKFQVRAANSDGIWSEQATTVALQMKPYFYQQGWFYAVCLVAVIMGFAALHKINVKRMAEREKMLTNLVAARTQELKEANESLQNLANSDGLTQVGNRRRFEEFLSGEWLRAMRSRTEISLILIDIDYFKLFNDTYGHQAGDECLKQVAAALTASINRPTDLVARFGGEEFAIILGGTDSAGAMNIAEVARTQVNNLSIPHRQSPTSHHLTISVGVATTFAKAGMTEADLISAADQSLYRAKENGRNQIQAFDFLTRTTSVSGEELIGARKLG